jgi:acetyl-CoA acyltransferase
LLELRAWVLSQWGYKPTPDYAVAKAGNEDYYWRMGLTAEAVSQQLKLS